MRGATATTTFAFVPMKRLRDYVYVKKLVCSLLAVCLFINKIRQLTCEKNRPTGTLTPHTLCIISRI